MIMYDDDAGGDIAGGKIGKMSLAALIVGTAAARRAR